MLLYHATFGANLSSIKQFGLGARQRKNYSFSEDGKVYLTDNSDVAYDFCEWAEEVSDYKYNSGIVVLAISSHIIKPYLISYDRNIKDIRKKGTGICYEYNGIIHPNNIFIVSNKNRNKRIIGKLTDLKRVPRYY